MLKSNKINRFKLLIILLIFLFSIIFIIPVKNDKTVIGNIRKQVMDANTKYKDIKEISNKMYVTMLDKDSKIINTTNPNTSIDNIYKFDATTEPQEKLNFKDNYYVLFEIFDTNDKSGYTKIKEETVYTLDLPDSIDPIKVYDDGITINDKCMQFNDKNSNACGGIYKVKNKYQFQVKFTNIKNKTNIKANYQFQIKLEKKLKKIVFNVKTINFNYPGILQIWTIDKDDNKENQNYTITNQTPEYVSQSHKFIKWTNIITDNEENKNLNGELNIKFSDYLGMYVSQDEWFTNLKIYADGTELVNNNKSKKFYTEFCDSNGNVLVTTNSIKDALENDYQSEKNYDTMLNSFTLNFKNVSGIKEWKIEVKAKDYLLPSTQTAVLSENINLNTTNGDKIDSQNSITKDYGIISTSGGDNKTYNEIPDEINYSIDISPTYSNFIHLEEQIDYHDASAFYYLQNLIRHNNDLSPIFSFNINGQDVKFSFSGPEPGYINQGYNHKDVLTQMQKVHSTEQLTNRYYVFMSDKKNSDGEYYYLIFSTDSESAYNSTHSLSKDLFATSADSDGITKPYPWSMYLWNAAGEEVKINMTMKKNAYKQRKISSFTGLYSHSEFAKMINIDNKFSEGFQTYRYTYHEKKVCY